MFMSKRFLLAISSIVCINFALSSSILAKQERRFPHGCRDVGSSFKGNLLILEPESEETPQTLFLVHNISGSPVMLKRKRVDSKDFGPNYKNVIRYNQWGIFVTDKPMLYFSCHSKPHDGYSYQLDCRDVVELCQFTRAKFGDGNNGNYWAVKSNGRRAGMRDAIRQGILLRW